MFSRATHWHGFRFRRDAAVTLGRHLLPLVLILGCGQTGSGRPGVQGGEEPSGERPSGAIGDSGATTAAGADGGGPFSVAEPHATWGEAGQVSGEAERPETGAPAASSDQPSQPDAMTPVPSELDASTEQDASTASPSRAGGPCPDAPPELGAACEPWGTFCTYDRANDVASAAQCREAYNCHSTGVWTSARVPGVELCFAPPPAQCAEPVSTGQACEAGALACSSGEATCECTTGPLCSPDGQCADPAAPRSYAWFCTAQQPECPWAPDNAGTRCEDATSRCLYGDPCGGVYVVCIDGYTEWESALCP